MGAIIKKFGKKTAKHMADKKIRHTSWKKMGLKGPTYKIGKKVKGSHHLDEVWTYDKNYREGKAEGGRIGFSRAGPVGNLPWVRGTSRPGVKKAPRGAQHKETIKQEIKDTGLHKGSVRKAGSLRATGTPRPHKTKSDYSLERAIKQTKKMPDKKFKHVNLETKTIKHDRTGKMVKVKTGEDVKGSKGKKNYITMMKYYHHRAQPKGKK